MISPSVKGECFVQIPHTFVIHSLLHRPRSQSGFVLQLAISASAVLLLGSASILTLSLQKRLRIHASGQRALGADQLRSAAQAFVAATHGPESCLLKWADPDWSTAAQVCVGSDPAELMNGLVEETPWSLLVWQPSGTNGRLQLQLGDGRTGRFRLALHPVNSSVLGMSDVQLHAISQSLEMN